MDRGWVDGGMDGWVGDGWIPAWIDRWMDEVGWHKSSILDSVKSNQLGNWGLPWVKRKETRQTALVS